MRTLLILRGAPGAGKSTWIKENHLENYTLCPDDLRILCSSTSVQADGNFIITRNHNVETMVWKVLFELLEYRMIRGEFTVIDATASKTKDIKQYKDLATQYKYKVYCVDFTDIPLETCLAQNKLRPSYKWVPEDSIKNIYARFATQTVPAGVTVIKPNELNKVLDKPFDLSEYKKIVFVGDIHGCYDTLMQYPDFKDGLKDDTEYIFLGDYVDRGNQNAETMLWINSIMEKPNVCLLEGNHEKHLRDFGNNVPVKAKEFSENTQRQLLCGGYDQKMARMFYRKCRQMSHFTYNGLEILACHGGIPAVDTNLSFIPTRDFIEGVGEYKDNPVIADYWMQNSKENQYLIHGHRNVFADETRVADRVFNLEGKVEYGGALRIVELTDALEWNIIELEDCQPVNVDLNTEVRTVDTVEDAVAYLRNNKFIQEKKLNNGISSFNFTREAFFKGNWNNQTVLARGLFIDTENNQIMARSYEKFFRINEVHETELASLRERLQFPVTAYVKENGFLAIVSYNYLKDDLFVASKSTDQGDYVGYIKNQLKPIYKNVLDYLRAQYQDGKPVSMVFECEDIDHDPHIIKYSENHLVLLDIIQNSLDYKVIEADNYYNYLNGVADTIGCPVKEIGYIIKDWDQFMQLYLEISEDDYTYNNRYIEGFVFTDSTGFMTKCKTGYYNLWKKLRGVADKTLKFGHYSKTGILQSKLENLFYGFCRELYNKDYNRDTKEYPYKTDIISLRDKFLGGNYEK